MRLHDLANQVGGALRASPNREALEGLENIANLEIDGVARPEDALGSQIAPIFGKRAVATRAGVIFASQVLDERPHVIVDDVRARLVDLLRLFAASARFGIGIDSRAAVEDSARVDPSAHIGPFAYLGAGVFVGPGAVVEPFAYVGPDVRIEAGARIRPHAVLLPGVRVGADAVIGPGCVVGNEGFGFVSHDGQSLRIPSLGTVEIAAGAELGANATVDRATLGNTYVGAGAKIDAQVHVGHNSQVGENAILCAQTGLAGSVRIGSGAVLGGQVGIADHVEVGEGARIGAKSGVPGNVRAGGTVTGYPPMPHMQWLRAMARLRRGGW